ncbi:archaeosortase/exosortase family protein [Chloroflexota bacterium]
MKIRLIIWLIACLAISVFSFGELWAKLPQWLSPEGLQSHGVFHWGALGLCILWLWLKRRDIIAKMRTGSFRLPYTLTGMVFLALAIFAPRSDDLLVFLMLLGFLGIFVAIFNRASHLPSILLAIYGFSLVFPVLMIKWLGEPSAIVTTSTVTAIVRILGLPVTSEGIVLYIACRTGYTTIGVFITLFALMTLDIRLPLKRVWYVFLIGLAGTWLQNIIRIILSISVGYYWGAGALQSMHYNIAYIIFPLWYALFAYIYMRQAGWKRTPVKQ